MHEFNWLDQRGVEGTPLVRTLRSLLVHQLPQILPDTRLAINHVLDDTFTTAGGNPTSTLLVRAAVARMNAFSFFGEKQGMVRSREPQNNHSAKLEHSVQ